jgi:3-phosphoshikimate 1-carboxyvinyltransferase
VNSCNRFLTNLLKPQGDVKFAEVLEMMGAKVTWTETSVTVTGPPREPFGRKHLKAIDVNMNKMPDVAMTLAVVALFADGPTAIRDGKTFSALQPCLFYITT